MQLRVEGLSWVNDGVTWTLSEGKEWWKNRKNGSKFELCLRESVCKVLRSLWQVDMAYGHACTTTSDGNE